MNSPTVSVVMSVFNGQAFLREAVESILGQTFGDFEFVVIDDGSTDQTSDILAEYMRRDARMHVVRQKNRGRTESLNRGIDLGRGKYVARMDADDVALPDRLERQIDFLEKHSDVGLVGGVVELIGREGNVLRIVRPPVDDIEIRSLLLQYNPMWHSAISMRTAVVLAAGRYRTMFSESEDYDLWLRLSEQTRLANLDELVLRYRVHSSQVSIENMRQQSLCVLVARAAAVSRRRGDGDPLAKAKEITPELARAIGIKADEVELGLLDAYRYWTELLEPSDPEASLRIVNGFLQAADPEYFGRTMLADLWLKAAGLQYQLAKPISALLSGARGVLTRPVVAGRPLKRALVRLAAALKG
jgi:glycosyltransferase involved in cell wall biosynthesis